MNKKVLLVDPHSFKQAPPKELTEYEELVANRYSIKIRDMIRQKIGDRHNLQNAMTGKYVTNYGLLMIGGQLAENGISVTYINGDYWENEEDFLMYILSVFEEYEMLVFTATTPQYDEVCRIAKTIKKYNQDIILACGGPHITALDQSMVQVFDNEPFDLISVGYDITPFIILAKEIIQEKKIIGEQTIIRTTTYKDYPKDFSLIPQEKIGDTLLYSYVSFGCPRQCRYCIEHSLTSKVCFPHIHRKIDEIKTLVNTFGVSFVHLADSDFFLNIKYAEKFLQELAKENLQATFSINLSPSSITDVRAISLIRTFEKMGLIEVLIGVEHFSEKVLRTANKYYSISELYRAMVRLRESEVNIIVSFYSLVGLPGEEKGDISENISWFRKFYEAGLVDFTFPKFFVPYPGTVFFEEASKYGLSFSGKDWKNYHRWGFPRVVNIQGMDNSEYLEEIRSIHRIQQKAFAQKGGTNNELFS